MSVHRRTLLRLAAAGLSSALLPLVACAKKIGQGHGTTQLPTPDAPLTPTAAWYEYSIQGAYEVDRRSYRLKVRGMCDRALTWSDGALREELPPRVVAATLACVGNPPGGELLSSALFRGARVSDLMDAASVSPRATGALITGLDSFAALRTVEDLRRPESLIAYDMGASADELSPLPLEHGFPARLLTPGVYGYVQPKWIDTITFVDNGGYQEVLDRSISYVNGAMQLASGFSRPRGGELDAGKQEVLGYAFGDGRPIGAVHVRVDGGPWREAQIVYNSPEDDLPPYLWCLWRLSWQATAGAHTLTSRATYEDGETQIDGRAFPYSGGSPASIHVTVKEAA